ncbi:2-hydroxy-3-oxopropionate reductase [Chelatococcus asaccharovorans]|uniref:2-hydroxy-3-oxopropionate reductase n=1 Tax=Chelatococcus asaccharovorans TaxID=28210 RepID=A0A2V3U714_9HYPH|nr:2-hydroxy-3-oxopropionate reductase [Chelatococcus asaccharovorans]
MAVVDPRADVVDEIVGKGGRRSDVGSVGAEVDIVVTCLSSESAIDAVYHPIDGLLGAPLPACIVDLSTCGPAMAARLGAAVGELGGHFIDAPVSGGREKALAGTLAVIAAGTPAAFTAAGGFFKAIGAELIVVGDVPGQAQIAKLINNVLSYVALAATSEALVLGKAAGLDPERVLAAVNAGSGRNSASASKIPSHVLTRNFDFGATNEISHKDLGLFASLAEELALPVPIATQMLQLLRGWRRGRETEDMTTIAQLFEGWGGVTLERRAER